MKIEICGFCKKPITKDGITWSKNPSKYFDAIPYHSRCEIIKDRTIILDKKKAFVIFIIGYLSGCIAMAIVLIKILK